MLANRLFRLLFLPLGLLYRLYDLAVAGSRDIHNKLRFRRAIVDKDCCIDPRSVLEGRCHVLENSLILNSSIGQFSYVGRNSRIQNTVIGSYCSIANDVFIGLGTHPKTLFATSPLFYRVVNTFGYRLVEKNCEFAEYRPIEIGHDVWIGARAIVMDGVRIGNGAIVASNAVVTKDVPPYAIVAGVPAKIISHRFPPEKIQRLQQTQWWSWPVDEIRNRMKDLNDL